ncbi:lipoyl(octanoyl) transferase LipB [Sansalvadorimonas sp. 2012CJ34-2]|uniref:Octanoyltransferase n=1 Tax=Parendozoicomonas callyspongiae TaxID=2942213 RepID=A0ABT0PD29_9GAMM|nr:lipoyl(octanoyl) transferase LipB [Sansalvadorimonas sp. 2012CJ34-2]MCL6269131.1 lipoyl(octanoyl) transferase LipB [Sansalvadorimonas sp. 2012CJ34-2]
MNNAEQLIIRELGLKDYVPVWQAMTEFTAKRDKETPDELWLVEHPPVFTQGQAGKAEHVLAPGDIPVVQVDRGGQVTYHGPGQQVVYLMLDVRRLKLGVRDLVTCMENAVIATLAEYGIESAAKPDAPGVYVGEAKIAALGLRIRRGCSFHGLSLNVDMDMEPFQRINPCGYADMSVAQMKDYCPSVRMTDVARMLVKQLVGMTGYTELNMTNQLSVFPGSLESAL